MLLIPSREKVASSVQNMKRSNRRVSFTTDKSPVDWHRLPVEVVASGVCEMDTKRAHLRIAELLSV